MSPASVSTTSEAATMFDEEDFDAAYKAPPQALERVRAGVDDDGPNHATAATEGADDRSEDDDDGYESIGGYRIHPAATLFPLMTGERFAELVESIRESGQTAPIIQANDGSIMDGRNRLLAVEQLRAGGHEIEPWIELWEPEGGQTEGEFILAANLHRRHLTDDQRAMIVAELVPFIKAEAEERQKATRFKKGKTKNLAGTNQNAAKEVVATDPSPPHLKTKKRTSTEKEAGSTRGQVAGRGDVSSHKAGKAIAVQRSGDKQIIKKVKDGDMTLAQAEKVVKPKAKKKAAAEPYDLEKDVTAKWTRWIEKWPPADRPDVRKIVIRLIKDWEKSLPKR